MVRTAVLGAFGELAPNARFAVSGASFDWEETVTVTGLTVAGPDAARPPRRSPSPNCGSPSTATATARRNGSR